MSQEPSGVERDSRLGPPAGETGSEEVEALKRIEAEAAASQAGGSSWERELVARCLAGDEEAFARIVDTYGGLLLRTAYLLVKDEEAAKDLVQEAFFLAWKNMATLRDPALLRSWLLRILVNQAISLKRQLARQAALLRERLAGEEPEQLLPKTSLREGRVEDWLDVIAALQRLPVKQRVVLVLFYYHRLTMPEIAAMLGVAENTLRKRLQLALKKMRRLLQIRPPDQQAPTANEEERADADAPPFQIASGREEQHE